MTNPPRRVRIITGTDRLAPLSTPGVAARRDKPSLLGGQGSFTCGTCGSNVTAKRATHGGEGVRKGDPVLSNHTPHGQRYRAMRGDVLCLGSDTPIAQHTPTDPTPTQ